MLKTNSYSFIPCYNFSHNEVQFSLTLILYYAAIYPSYFHKRVELLFFHHFLNSKKFIRLLYSELIYGETAPIQPAWWVALFPPREIAVSSCYYELFYDLGVQFGQNWQNIPHLISISVTCLPTKPFTSLICLSYRCNFAESLSSTPSTIITTCDLFCFISSPHQSFPTYLPTTPPKSNPIPQNSL